MDGVWIVHMDTTVVIVIVVILVIVGSQPRVVWDIGLGVIDYTGVLYCNVPFIAVHTTIHNVSNYTEKYSTLPKCIIT